MIRIFLLLLSLSNLTYPAIASNKLNTDIKTWHTKNNVPVFYLHAAEIPMLDIAVVFNAGSARDGSKFGLAQLTNSMMDEGTKQWSVDEIAERFESVGANFSADTDRDMASLHLRSLSTPSKLQPALATFADMISHPTFPSRALKRLQDNTLRMIEFGQQSSRSVANDIIYQLIYDNQPYAHPVIGQKQTVVGIKQQDVKDFYNRYYVANNALIAIVGDVKQQQATAIANQLTQHLASGQAAAPLPPTLHRSDQASSKQLHFPGTQTAIRLGTLGIKRSDNDYFPLVVGNHVLGGLPLLSRLFTEVREKRGLTYGAYSYFSPQLVAGPFIITMETRNAQVKTATDVSKQVLTTFVDNGPSAKELALAKKNIIGGFPLKLDSNSALLANMINIGFYRLPLNYLASYRDNINQVSRAEVKAAFAKHINSKKMATVTVGNTDANQ